MQRASILCESYMMEETRSRLSKGPGAYIAPTLSGPIALFSRSHMLYLMLFYTALLALFEFSDIVKGRSILRES